MKIKKFEFIDFESKSIVTQKTWLAIIMAVILYYTYTLLMTITAFIITIFQSSATVMCFQDFTESAFFSLFSLFATIIGIALVLLYVKFLEKRSLSTAGIIKTKFFRNYFFGYAIGKVMISLPVFVLILFKGNISFNQDVNYGLLILYFIGFLIQGASEEIMTRGYILTTLAKTTGIMRAIIISSLVFAILHLFNPNMSMLAFVNLFLFGVFASLFYLRTKNIWAISALHAAWNFFQGNVFGIEVSGLPIHNSVFNVTANTPDILSGGTFGLEGGLIITVILILSCAVVLFSGENKLIFNDIDAETSEEIL